MERIVAVSRLDFLDLRVRGDLDGAERLLNEAIASGAVWARAALAQLYAVQGKGVETVHDLLQSAEQDAEDDDADAHMELFKAYELSLGEEGFEWNQRMAMRHLELVALYHPDPVQKLAIARRYRDGTAVIEPDFQQAEKWYQLAIRDGSDEAVDEWGRLQELRKGAH